MTEREKIIDILNKNFTQEVECTFVYTTADGKEIELPQELCDIFNDIVTQAVIPYFADALIAAGIALRGERMKYERLTKKICGYYHGKSFVGGKGVINDREYCRGCFDATAIVDRLGELEDKIEAGEIDYVADRDKEIARLTSENAELRATLSKMETVEKELRERLEKAVELPCIEPMTTWDWDENTGCGKARFGKFWKVLYRDNDGELIVYLGATKEEATAMLAELKEEKNG